MSMNPYTPVDQRDTMLLRLKATVYAVEANRNEHHQLWNDHCTSVQPAWRAPTHEYHRVVWEQLSDGYGWTFGYDHRRPMMVMLTWARISGHLVLFYEATSQLVNHETLKEWLYATLPHLVGNDNKRYHFTDAQNFHQVIHHCRDLSKITVLT